MGGVRMTAPTVLFGLADEVRAEARRIDVVKVLLTVLALLPFLLGWTAGVLVRGCWTTVLWTWAAVRVGWRTGHGRTDGGG